MKSHQAALSLPVTVREGRLHDQMVAWHMVAYTFAMAEVPASPILSLVSGDTISAIM